MHGTMNIKWTDMSKGSASCGIMSSVQASYVVEQTAHWTVAQIVHHIVT